MKNQIGSPVRGEDFFKRDALVNKAWDLVQSGAHILIAAPRRVGKTSLMRYLEDHPRRGFSFLFDITESVSNENEFFRRIMNKLLRTDYVKRSRKVMAFLETYIPRIEKVGPEGVEFGVREEHDYKAMFQKTLASCSQGEGKLIIMIDEFPQTLENIINNEGKEAGVHFLQSNREIRQESAVWLSAEISLNIGSSGFAARWG